MGASRAAGILWIVGGLSSAFIAMFLTEPVDLAVFITGAVVGVVLGVALVVRPVTPVLSASDVAGLGWAVAYGMMIALNLGVPIEQLISVVWVLGFGVGAAIVARRGRRPRVAFA